MFFLIKSNYSIMLYINFSFNIPNYRLVTLVSSTGNNESGLSLSMKLKPMKDAILICFLHISLKDTTNNHVTKKMWHI